MSTISKYTNYLDAFLRSYYLHPIYLIALVSVLGSLYASEIEKLAPCPLCWYQRIAMYPILAIAMVAIAKKDMKAWIYILPLSIIGNLIAFYHVFLQAAGESSGLPGCSAVSGQPSCAVVETTILGFLTIPMLSALSFVGINVIIAAYVYFQRKK